VSVRAAREAGDGDGDGGDPGIGLDRTFDWIAGLRPVVVDSYVEKVLVRFGLILLASPPAAT
jgi:hypothetical protein